jgi:glutamyl-tRNA synthetase
VARPLDRAYVTRVLRLEQERMKTLAEAPAMTAFFFSDRVEYDPALLLPKGLEATRARMGLTRAAAILSAAPDWQAPALEEPLRALVAELELKPVQLFTALRAAVTGRTVSPPLFDTFEVLGRERTLARVRAAIALVPE